MIVPLALAVPTKHLIIVSLLAIAAGLYLLFRGLSVLARQNRQRTPSCKIAAALPGLVEVNGIATGPNTITAPIEGKPCFLYRTTVWQQRKTASHEWEKLAEETLHVPFFLDDSTGQVLIEPLGGDLELQSEFHKEYDPSLFFEQNRVPPAVSLFLARHGVTPARRIRIEECCIWPESAVFVAGTVTENPGVEVRPVSPRAGSERKAGYFGVDSHLGDADAPQVIRLSVSTEPLTVDAMTQQSKIAAALVKAGIRNPDAWAAAGVRYPEASRTGDPEAREVGGPPANGRRETQPSEPRPDPQLWPALVLMKGAVDAPFLISWRSQRELGRAYVWKCAVMLSGGTILSLAGLCLLIVKAHLL